MLLRLFCLGFLTFAVNPIRSEYLVTTPRRWTQNTASQICVVLTEGTISDADVITYTLKERKHNATLVANAILPLPIGNSEGCVDVEVPNTVDNSVSLTVEGILGGSEISERVNLTVYKEPQRRFIQTDKKIYRQGQTVQIRILTLKGPGLKVDTTNYEEIYINNPSGTRIAQWLNVSNADGLVHLSFDLFDEAEEGSYKVRVKKPDATTDSVSFRVEDYVLPRYEVTVKAPKNILGSDSSVSIKVCAKYTFGEPVSGYANVSLAAGSWKIYANLTEGRKIKGCSDFTFPTDQLYFDQNNCHIRISNLKARVTVVEDGTEVELQGSDDSIRVHRKALSFEDLTREWVQKPFLPYSVKILAKSVDGLPATNELMNVCTQYEEEKLCRNFTTDNEGILSFLMPGSFQSRVEVKALNYPKIERHFNDVMTESKYSKYRYRGESYVDSNNASLTIFMEDKVNCTTGENVVLSVPVLYVTNDQSIADAHYQVLSRGQVVLTDKIQSSFRSTGLPFAGDRELIPLEPLPAGLTRGMFEIQMTLPPSVSPSIRILVWYSDAKGGVIADSLEVDVSACLSHAVSLDWSEPEAEPGTDVDVLINGANNALCSLGVVDKSVELLFPRDPLKARDILELARNSDVKRWDNDQLTLDYCLEKYNSSKADAAASTEPSVRDIPFDRYSSLEALHMFSRAGYFVMSDLTLERRYCDKLIIESTNRYFTDYDYDMMVPYLGRPQLIPISSISGPVPANAVFIEKLSAGAPRPPPAPQAFFSDEVHETSSFDKVQNERADEPRERSNLPETWLWTLNRLGADGNLQKTVTLPDQITEWVGKTVCVHPEQGLGLSKKASVKTFTPFFVDLTLPASVQRGEILPVKISIFNYLPEDLPVKVTVEPSEDHEFLGTENGVRTLCIQADSKSVVTVRVNFVKIADVNLTIEAATDLSAAATCGNGNPPTKADRFVRSIPVEAEGFLREKTWSKYVCPQDLSADESGTETWEMAAPENIVETSERSWITAIGDLMGPSIEHLGSLVRLPSGCGEQNMVNFAPVVYIMQYLETSNQNTEFLKNKIGKFLTHGYQRELKFKHKNGSFSAFGESDSQGSTWLTAFVVKAFAQAKPYTLIDRKLVQKSTTWLLKTQDERGCFQSRGRVINKMLQGGLRTSGNSESLLTAYVLAAILEQGDAKEKQISAAIDCIKLDTSTHPYSLALRAYSSVLAKAPGSKALLDQLLASAVSNSSVLRWDLPDRKGTNTALHVETAAYVLLALTKYDPNLYVEESRKILRWISNQMNGQGGYVSTQDTVVALQALAAYENSKTKGPLNIDATITAKDLAQSFKVKENNKFLQQLVEVPQLPSSVNIAVTGQGCALLQGVLRYNVLADSKSDAFTLTVDVVAEKRDCKTQRIKACTSYTLPDEASNMAIIEVKLVSGHIPIKQDLKDIIGDGKGQFKRYEVDGLKVFFYLEEVTKEQVCVDFRAKREIEIENAKPGAVSVYDYYQTEFKTTQKFVLDSNCV